MNIPLYRSLLVLSLLAVSQLTLSAAEPDADQLLREMSAKLASAKSFRVEAIREIDAALIENSGVNLPVKASVSVTVQRPNKLAGHSISAEGTRRFYFDGRTLSLLDEKTGLYSSIPMRTTLDGLADQLDAKYGFTPPLVEFALSDPYKEFRRQAESISYVGRVKAGSGFLGMGGVECHRLALKGPVADGELWIGVSDHLPYKLVATFKARPGKPHLWVAFSKWNLAAPVTASDFIFTPPAGAQKIEMWTTAKMQSAAQP